VQSKTSASHKKQEPARQSEEDIHFLRFTRETVRKHQSPSWIAGFSVLERGLSRIFPDSEIGGQKNK
jgi:hypothetical protein